MSSAPHTPLHSKLGAAVGPQSDKSKVAEVAQAYVDKIKSGAMTVEHISEIHLGGGRYVRSFVIQE
jgi:hypothetical protein